MGVLRYSASMSLDGFVAGRGQGPQHPLGEGGERLHGWMRGRNMFGGGPAPWGDPPWKGWWGDEPPFRMPGFVLTHYPRPPLECRGGTAFTFVTGGLQAALDLAREAARGRDVAVSDGAGFARQFLRAGLVDELMIHLVPVLLGGGVRLFEGTGSRRSASSRYG